MSLLFPLLLRYGPRLVRASGADALVTPADSTDLERLPASTLHHAD
jgi:hypothetical protein